MFGGIRERFLERIRNFRFFKNNINNEENKNINVTKETNIIKNKKTNVVFNTNVKPKVKKKGIDIRIKNNEDVLSTEVVDKKKVIATDSVARVKKKSISTDVVDIDKKKEISTEAVDVENLKNKILDKIEDKVLVYKNSLEIIASELYVIKDKCDDLVDEEKVIREKKILDDLLERVKKIREQYNIIRYNYDFDNVMELDDSNLIDSIIELKNKVSAKGIIDDDYELSEKIISLGVELDDIEDKTNILIEEHKNSLVKNRIDHDYIQNMELKVDNYQDIINDAINNISTKTSDILELNKKVGVINSRREIVKKTVGVGKLIMGQLKYFSLLLLSPFKGLFPTIAVSTLAARDMVKNLNDSLRVEEYEKIIYYAHDYSKEIDNNLYSVKDIDDILSSTLVDIVNIKEKLINKYGNSKVKEFDSLIDKLSSTYSMLVDNKVKLKILESDLLKSKKINSDKMKKLEVLNKHS